MATLDKSWEAGGSVALGKAGDSRDEGEAGEGEEVAEGVAWEEWEDAGEETEKPADSSSLCPLACMTEKLGDGLGNSVQR